MNSYQHTKLLSDEEEAIIRDFILQSQPIVEDPRAGKMTLLRLTQTGMVHWKKLTAIHTEAMNVLSAATAKLDAAQRNPGTPASAMFILEVDRDDKKAEHERIKTLWEDLDFEWEKATSRWALVATDEDRGGRTYDEFMADFLGTPVEAIERPNIEIPEPEEEEQVKYDGWTLIEAWRDMIRRFGKH